MHIPTVFLLLFTLQIMIHLFFGPTVCSGCHAHLVALCAISTDQTDSYICQFFILTRESGRERWWGEKKRRRRQNNEAKSQTDSRQSLSLFRRRDLWGRVACHARRQFVCSDKNAYLMQTETTMRHRFALCSVRNCKCNCNRAPPPPRADQRQSCHPPHTVQHTHTVSPSTVCTLRSLVSGLWWRRPSSGAWAIT